MAHVELKQLAGQWKVRVERPDGRTVEYRYPSETQARFFAAVFALGPRQLPPHGRLCRKALLGA